LEPAKKPAKKPPEKRPAKLERKKQDEDQSWKPISWWRHPPQEIKTESQPSRRGP
jgi:hypothetical protein